MLRCLEKRPVHPVRYEYLLFGRIVVGCSFAVLLVLAVTVLLVAGIGIDPPEAGANGNYLLASAVGMLASAALLPVLVASGQRSALVLDGLGVTEHRCLLWPRRFAWCELCAVEVEAGRAVLCFGRASIVVCPRLRSWHDVVRQAVARLPVGQAGQVGSTSPGVERWRRAASAYRLFIALCLLAVAGRGLMSHESMWMAKPLLHWMNVSRSVDRHALEPIPVSDSLVLVGGMFVGAGNGVYALILWIVSTSSAFVLPVLLSWLGTASTSAKVCAVTWTLSAMCVMAGGGRLGDVWWLGWMAIVVCSCMELVTAAADCMASSAPALVAQG